MPNFYSSLGDSWIDSVSPTYQHGGYPALKVGTSDSYRSLLRFDLSAIPPTAICKSASLHLFVETQMPNAATLNLYKISDANGGWVTGTGLTGAVTGMACWNFKAYHASTPTNWAGSAGLSTADTDYINTVLATYTITPTDEVGTDYTFPFNASGLAVLQDWFGDATNNGFLLISDGGISTELRVHSYETATTEYKPCLVVEYSTGMKSYRTLLGVGR